MDEVARNEYQPGQMIPGSVYRVNRLIGAGGMGTVYDVEDVSVGKRYVLKTLHAELSNRADLARRMQQEARALARLKHPHIVDVITASSTTDSLKLPFYVMEKLNGQNLRMLLERKKTLPLSNAVHIATDLLDALACAHENGVIHRDVKPDNVFLHNDNGKTLTKLLDFGISRFQDEAASSTTGQRFVGTLRYAAPEQLLGGPITPRTDLYALGLVLYEMIAGRGPFDDLGHSKDIGEAHIHKLPPRLIDLEVVVPDVLERLLRSALAKDPEQRPRDAFTFDSQLRSMLLSLQRDRKPDRTDAPTVANILQGAQSTVHPSSPLITTRASQPPPSGSNEGPTDPALALTHHASTHASTPAAKARPEEVTHTAFGMPAMTVTPQESTLVSSQESAASHVDRSAETRSAVIAKPAALGPAGTEPIEPELPPVPSLASPGGPPPSNGRTALGTDGSAVSNISVAPPPRKRPWSALLVGTGTFAVVGAATLGLALRWHAQSAEEAPSVVAAPMLATPLFDEVPSAAAPGASPAPPVVVAAAASAPSAAVSSSPPVPAASVSAATPPASSAAAASSASAVASSAPAAVAPTHDAPRPRPVRPATTAQPAPTPAPTSSVLKRRRPGSGL